MHTPVLRWLLMTLTLCVAACAPRPPEAAAPSQPATTHVVKRISAAALGDVFSVSTLLSVSGAGTATPGIAEIERLVNAGVSIPGTDGFLEPQLAEAVPTIENGLWRVLPDGR